jgi:hypothetical protein
VAVSRESDAVTSSTCRTNPPTIETVDVFYINRKVKIKAKAKRRENVKVY